MNKIFSKICTNIAGLLGKPMVFIVNLIFVFACVALCIKYPNDALMLVFNTFLSIMSYLMLFIIQNSQNRDGAALQAKLDELIRTTKNAHNALIGIENKTIEELQEMTRELQKNDKPY